MSAESPRSRPSNSATIWVALTLFASAAEPLIVKFAYQASASPVHLTVLKLIFGGLFIAPIYRQMRWIGRDGLKQIVLPSALYISTYGLIYWALVTMPASSVITIISGTPARVALINQRRGLEQSTLKFWLGVLACFIGILLTIGALENDFGTSSYLGALLALGSVVTSALYRTRMDKLTKKIPPIVVSGYLFGFNTLAGLLALPFILPIPSSTVPVALVTGLIAAVANVAFLSALSLVGSTRISVLTALQRPIVVITAALILAEPISPLQVVGIVLVLAGVQMAKVVPKSAVRLPQSKVA